MPHDATATTTVQTSAGPAEVRLRAGEPGVGLLVLTHGSAGTVDAPDLVTLGATAHALGWTVAAVTQPFRLAGRRNPGKPEGQDAAWIEVVTALRATTTGPLIQAGRSNGARVACRTADALDAAGVIALAFPVHPPGAPDKHRRDELDAPTAKVLVVQGERDPFGMPAARRGRRRVVVVPGSDHSLRGADPVIAKQARAFLRAISAHPS